MAPSGRKSASGKKGNTKPRKEEEAATKKKKAATRSYKSYIHALLKKQNAGKDEKQRITSKGMAIVHSFVTDVFERLAGEASRLNAFTGKKTLDSKAVVAAVKLQLPGEMATAALTAGATAVGQYSGKGKKSKH